jgi:hypothetical protein
VFLVKEEVFGLKISCSIDARLFIFVFLLQLSVMLLVCQVKVVYLKKGHVRHGYIRFIIIYYLS